MISENDPKSGVEPINKSDYELVNVVSSSGFTDVVMVSTSDEEKTGDDWMTSGDYVPYLPWFVFSAEQVLSIVHSSAVTGLTTDSVERRFKHFGSNTLPSTPPKSFWVSLLEQLNSALVYTLLVGAAVSFAWEHWPDGGVILAVVVINVSLGLVMEGRAASSAAALSSLMTTSATVLRNKEKVSVTTSELVPGDILILTAGDVIPADCRVLWSADFEVAEAALTGESTGVVKDSAPIRRASIMDVNGAPPSPPAERQMSPSGKKSGKSKDNGGNNNDDNGNGKISLTKKFSSFVAAVRADSTASLIQFNGVKTRQSEIFDANDLRFQRLLETHGIGSCELSVPLGDRHCLAFAGTQVLRGSATAVVVATGAACELGRISALLSETEEKKTPLLVQLEALGTRISLLILVVALGAMGVAKARGYSWPAAMSLTIGIAVAAIPEGLPSCVTIAFASGVRKLAKHNALVKSLPGVETLGSVSVICSDKTGTLTMNKMSVAAVAAPNEWFEVSYGMSVEQSDSKEPEISEGSGSVQVVRRDGAPFPIDSIEPGEKMPNDDTPLSLWQRLVPGIFCTDASLRMEATSTMHQSNSEKLNSEADVEQDTQPVAAESSSNSRSIGGYVVSGDPTETCILRLAVELLGAKEVKRWQDTYSPVDVVPFDSAVKYMATSHLMPRSLIVHMLNPSSEKLAEVTSTGEDSEDILVMFIKGAPEVIAQFGRNDPNVITSEDFALDSWRGKATRLASQGMRVLGLAYKLAPASSTLAETLAAPCGFTLDTLVGILDPPRPDAVQAIAEAQAAGVTVKMITGDHPVTALAIGKKLGLRCGEPTGQGNRRGSGAAITGSDLDVALFTGSLAHVGRETAAVARKKSILSAASASAAISSSVVSHDSQALNNGNKIDLESSRGQEAFDELVLTHDVFARVSPEHKLRIVQSLQRQGLIVSMTGDGVNDAPALKAADMGVAMGITGTEVAKGAAEMILTDDRLATLVTAIRVGRATYANLTKILAFCLPTNGGQATALLLSLAIGLPMPITPLQVLWANMVTSLALGLVLAFEAPHPAVMSLPPRRAGKKLLGRFMSWRISLVTSLITVAVIGGFHWEKSRHNLAGSPDYSDGESLILCRTVASNALVATQMGYVFSCRLLRENFANPIEYLRGNKVLWLGFFCLIPLQAIYTYVPPLQYVFQTAGLPAECWGIVVLMGVSVFIIVELEKWLVYHYWKPVKAPPVPYEEL